MSSDGLNPQTDTGSVSTGDAATDRPATDDAATAIADASQDATLASNDAAQTPDAAPDLGDATIGEVPENCQASAGDNACASCQKANCCETYTSCTGECEALYNCYSDCDGTSSSCTTNCTVQHAAGITGVNAIVNCVKTSCATPCADQL